MYVPAPAAVTADAIHLRNGESEELRELDLGLVGDGSSAYTAKGTSDDTGREEQRHAPLELETLVIHADEVDTSYICQIDLVN